MHFLFIRNLPDIATEKVMTKNCISALKFSEYSKFVSHHCVQLQIWSPATLCHWYFTEDLCEHPQAQRQHHILGESFSCSLRLLRPPRTIGSHTGCEDHRLPAAAAAPVVTKMYSSKLKMPVTGVCD